MLFFLARSALCIGVVAVAASGVGTGRLAADIDRRAREAVDGAGRACLASSDCLRVGTVALSAASSAVPGRSATAPSRPADAPRRLDARAIRAAKITGG